MRITPVSMTYNRHNLRAQNQNAKQNVSFGNFENDELREEAKSTWLNPERDDDGLTRWAFEYLDATPFVTIKKRKDITYVVMNKDVTDKHEFKENFDYEFKNKRSTIPISRLHKPAKEAGIVDDEPNYLTTIKNDKLDDEFANKSARNLYQDLWDAERNHEWASSPKEPEYEKSDLEKINDLYGFH